MDNKRKLLFSSRKYNAVANTVFIGLIIFLLFFVHVQLVPVAIDILVKLIIILTLAIVNEKLFERLCCYKLNQLFILIHSHKNIFEIGMLPIGYFSMLYSIKKRNKKHIKAEIALEIRKLIPPAVMLASEICPDGAIFEANTWILSNIQKANLRSAGLKIEDGKNKLSITFRLAMLFSFTYCGMKGKMPKLSAKRQFSVFTWTKEDLLHINPQQVFSNI